MNDAARVDSWREHDAKCHRAWQLAMRLTDIRKALATMETIARLPYYRPTDLRMDTASTVRDLRAFADRLERIVNDDC